MAIEHFSPTCIYPDNETIRSATIVKRVCCLLSPPPPSPSKTSLFRKRKERRFQWPKSVAWPGGEGGAVSKETTTVHGEMESAYVGYTWQSAYRSSREMRYSWESYVAETEADTRDTRGAHLNRDAVSAHAHTHWRKRGMKMRADDCLRRAGKRNLEEEGEESLRGVDGGRGVERWVQKVYDSPTCRSRKREMDLSRYFVEYSDLGDDR